MTRVDVERAREMREGGMTLQAVGDHFGVSREWIRQLVGQTLRSHACDWCGTSFATPYAIQRFCSTECRSACADESQKRTCKCGASIGPRSLRCWDCELTSREGPKEARRTAISQMWIAGTPMAEMVDRLDTTLNSLGVEIARMRNTGWELPFRREGWKGHSTPTAPEPQTPLTHQQARNQFAQAKLNGRIHPADACERCGRVGPVDGHHFDYSKPLEVEWLCRSCHMAHHSAERRAA